MVSSLNSYPTSNNQVVNISRNKDPESIRSNQNGQIQIYQSLYRGSYFSVIRDSLRNAALGRKVLLVQLMKGGVNQGISNAQKLCGNLTWIRSSNSYDQYESEYKNCNKNLEREINSSIIELWNY